MQQDSCKVEGESSEQVTKSNPTMVDLKDRLSKLGLEDLNIDSRCNSPQSKAKLVELIEEYEDIFSRHQLDCGDTKGLVHSIPGR